jgi:arginyl-tRNA synthetase
MNEFVRAIAARLADATGLPAADVEPLIEVPKDPKLGDYAFPCFSLAKLQKKAPPAIAKEVEARLVAAGLPPEIAFCAAAGPYVNFRVAPGAFARAVIGAALEAGERYGDANEGEGGAIPIDYGSPNIAKRFHVGHLRSTVIGGALYRIARALGYRPIGINHLGDWGTQFGHLMSAWEKWGEEARLAGPDPIGYLQELYVRHNREAKANPALFEDARRWFKRLEDGDARARELWQRFRDISLLDFQRIYDLLGTKHDVVAGESFYEDKMPEAIRLAEEKGVAEVSQGALIIDFKKHGVDIAEPMLLRRSDGATLYATRDLAAAIYRFRTYEPVRMLYVIGQEQRLAMRQLFAALSLLGYPGERCVHVDFGRVLGMSSREGTAVLLDEVLGRAIRLAREEVARRNPDWTEAEIERTARAVGIGAAIFADLKNKRTKDFEFDWDRIVRFDGETGPYLQYTHARLCAVLRNLEAEGARPATDADWALLSEPETLAVVKAIEAYPRKVRQAFREFEPSVLSQHLLEVAGALNAFYQQHRVKDAPTAPLRAARAALVEATRHVLAHGLRLLGIEPIERM